MHVQVDHNMESIPSFIGFQVRKSFREHTKENQAIVTLPTFKDYSTASKYMFNLITVVPKPIVN